MRTSLYLQEAERRQRYTRCTADYAVFAQDVVLQGLIPPDNLVLTGDHSWVPTEELHMLVWKLVQILSDHPAINGYLPLADLEHLMEHYVYEPVSAVLSTGELPPSADLQLCLDFEKAKTATVDLLKSAPAGPGQCSS